MDKELNRQAKIIQTAVKYGFTFDTSESMEEIANWAELFLKNYQPVERISWYDVRDTDDDNDGLVYGLNLYDSSAGCDENGEEQWQDIIDVEWFATEEERDQHIVDNRMRVVFD